MHSIIQVVSCIVILFIHKERHDVVRSCRMSRMPGQLACCRQFTCESDGMVVGGLVGNCRVSLVQRIVGNSQASNLRSDLEK